MKLTRQLLIIVLFVTGVLALYAGYLSFADSNAMLELFHVTPMPGMEMVVVFLGLFFFSFALIYLYASYLLIKRRQAGRTLASILGFVSAVSGATMYLKYKQFNIESGSIVGLVECAKGIVILLLAWRPKD